MFIEKGLGNLSPRIFEAKSALTDLEVLLDDVLLELPKSGSLLSNEMDVGANPGSSVPLYCFQVKLREDREIVAVNRDAVHEKVQDAGVSKQVAQQKCPQGRGACLGVNKANEAGVDTLDKRDCGQSNVFGLP